MTTVSTGLMLIVAIFAIVMFVARRLLRLAIKLAFVGAVIFALAGGGLFGWWRGWFSPISSSVRPAAQANQRTNSNRRRP